MSERRGLNRNAPQRGEAVLERQLTQFASGFRGPRAAVPDRVQQFGGGTSPVKTGDTIHRQDIGKVAVWQADGYLTVAAASYLTDAPADGLAYARNGLAQSWVPVASGAGIVEAPTTGLTYTRTGSTASWVPLPYILGEAPADGQGYVRIGLNQTWAAAYTEAQADARYAPISTVSFPEAPTDGQAYARRGWDRTWVTVATGSGVPEAPLGGNTYTRRGSDETWQLAFTQAAADGRYIPLSQLTDWVTEAPINTNSYVRTAGAWALALTQTVANSLYAPSSTVSFPEAPTDGRVYTRRGSDASWQVAATGSGIGEAPVDGRWYLRRGSDTSWQPSADLILDDGVY